MTCLIRLACTVNVLYAAILQYKSVIINVDRAASTTWEIWKRVKEDREIGGAKTQVTITNKITHNGTIEHFCCFNMDVYV